jgi:hypothetical protein
MTRASLLLASLLLLAPAAHAQTWDGGADDAQSAWLEQQAAATQAYRARIAAAMAASGDVREQALAELLRQPATAQVSSPAGDAPSRPVPRDAAADARLRAVAARAGGDRLANQLLIAAAGDPASPVRIEAARRWQVADPGNLAALLHTGAPVDALLAEARRATHASTRMYEAVRWIADAFLRHPLTAAERAALSGGDAYHEEEAAAVSAMALWATSMAPALDGLLAACRGTALRAAPTRSADCRHVADLLADRSDSVLERMIGLSLLRELATGSAERAAIDGQRRDMDWQMLQWGRVARQQPRDGAAQFVRLLRDDSIQSELQLVQRVLQEAGVPLEPPAGWTPPRR